MSVSEKSSIITHCLLAFIISLRRPINIPTPFISVVNNHVGVPYIETHVLRSHIDHQLGNTCLFNHEVNILLRLSDICVNELGHQQ